jgi:hypothetical protein
VPPCFAWFLSLPWTCQHIDGGTICQRQTRPFKQPPLRATTSRLSTRMLFVSGRCYPVYPPSPKSPESNRFNCALPAGLHSIPSRTPLRCGYIPPPLKGHPSTHVLHTQYMHGLALASASLMDAVHPHSAISLHSPRLVISVFCIRCVQSIGVSQRPGQEAIRSFR